MLAGDLRPAHHGLASRRDPRQDRACRHRRKEPVEGCTVDQGQGTSPKRRPFERRAAAPQTVWGPRSVRAAYKGVKNRLKGLPTYSSIAASSSSMKPSSEISCSRQASTTVWNVPIGHPTHSMWWRIITRMVIGQRRMISSTVMSRSTAGLRVISRFLPKEILAETRATVVAIAQTRDRFEAAARDPRPFQNHGCDALVVADAWQMIAAPAKEAV